jgi:predicted nucleic acid-binding protein
LRFWDTSALVPLLVGQPESARSDAWFAEDRAIVVWLLTSVEISSALCRLAREGHLTPPQHEAAEAMSDALGSGSHAVLDVEAVKFRARRLLRVHPLRAAEALQLGAALEWALGRPMDHVLHTFDLRLAAAARIEGFRVPA